MDTDSRQSNENCKEKQSDAGQGNKMASSSTSNGTKTIEYELKIMGVEGAVADDTAVIELVEDDVDVDSVPFVNELKMALINNTEQIENRDPLHEEEMSAKAEAISDVESVGSYNGPDPMGLLERIDSSQDVAGDDDDDDEEEESAGDGDNSSTGSHRRHNTTERWQVWMKRWPWLLHGESDGEFAFCLYCNVDINVNKKIKFVQQHNLSLYHQERENNYLAFKKSEKQSADIDDAVKHEYGSNNYVAAMKARRAKEVETLNNFNWERWLKWHSWLERTHPVGTIGLCKICNIRMNVEFVYLRKRHESSKGHSEARRQQEKASRKRKRSASPSEPTTELVSVADHKNSSKKHVEELPTGAPVATVVSLPTDSGVSVESGDPSDWCEVLPDTTPQQCRCTLCDCRMAITSFMRHLKTQVHCNNLESRRQNETQKKIDRGIWVQYADKHPWLVADPDDPTLAYCHVCCKRFIYGHSEIKRKNHENSENHMANAAAFHSAAAAAESEVQHEEQQVNSEVEQSEPESEGSDEDYVDEDSTHSVSTKATVIPATTMARTKRIKKRELGRDEESPVRIKTAPNETPNESFGEEPFINQRVIKGMPKAMVKPVPASMHGRVLAWRARFPWISYKRSEERRNYGWCKLCDTSVFMPSCKFASRHQRSTRHIRLRFERKRAVKEAAMGGGSIAAATAAALATGEARHKAAIAELQAKYPWLEGDATEENYCHCKICDTRLPIKVFYLRQHDGSRKHSDNVERSKAASNEVDAAVEATAKEAATKEQQAESAAMDVDQDSDEALSVKSECSNEEQTTSKRSRRAMEWRRVLRALRDSAGSKRHEERSQMDMARDMICSSFDIVKRLRTLERETETQSIHQSPMPYLRGSNDSPAATARGTIDLFFDSVSQTMKDLPADLAAEGKAKIMQIVSNLELRHLQRSMGTATTASPLQSEATEDSSPHQNNPKQVNKEARLTFDEVIESVGDSPDSDSSSVIFEEPTTEVSTPLQKLLHSNKNSNEIGHLSEITVTASQRVAPKPNPSPSQQKPAPTPTIINGIGKEVPPNIRSILPSTVQVGSRTDSADTQLRVVPINKLTTLNPNASPNPLQSRNSLNGVNPATPLIRNGQKIMSPANNTGLATPPSSNSSNQSEMNNATPTNPAVFHKIRVSNGSSSKVIRFQKSPVAQQQHCPPQQRPEHHQHNQHHQKIPIRYSSGGGVGGGGAGNTPNNSHIPHPTQAQALAQAQLRALKAQRPFTTIRPSQP